MFLKEEWKDNDDIFESLLFVTIKREAPPNNKVTSNIMQLPSEFHICFNCVSFGECCSL